MSATIIFPAASSSSSYLSVVKHQMIRDITIPSRRLGGGLSFTQHSSSTAACVVDATRGPDFALQCNEATKERIRKLFHKVEFSVSSYDTAWVAMVPSPHSAKVPCFPECLHWVLHNQLEDGSWGLPHHQPLLLKDVLSSTLACVLALKRWGIGEQLISNGLRFIELNFASATDKDQYSPIGFDVIFPGMLEYAQHLSLKLHLESGVFNELLHKRAIQLTRPYDSSPLELNAYLAYVSEGIGELQDWKMVMKYQRKNGSLFNSPSTTAASLIHLHDSGCLDYLRGALKKFGNAVPTIYPINIHARLCMVDDLKKLGICRHFSEEIQNVLDETYRCWLQGEDEIFTSAGTCSMAFRILRGYGYNVSSDPVAQFLEQEQCSGHLNDIHTMLDLYQALEMIIATDQPVSMKLNSSSLQSLIQRLSGEFYPPNGLTKQIHEQVDDVLKFPSHANLKRVANRRNIKHYDVDNTRVLKTSYSSSNFGNKDFLTLAVEDFNLCQSIHRNELKQLERWLTQNRLDKLKFARERSAYCYFSAAATIFQPELSDARMSWAKNGVLTTVIDDFFDVGGSMEELNNLILLFKKWDVDVSTDCCSERVGIIFSALHSTISEIGDKASKWQARSVTRHITDIWLNLLNAMLREAKWARDMSVPSLDKYMANGYVSFALGPIVLPALYFVGPKLPDDVVQHPEYHSLFELVSTCGRLLNDIRSFERESKDGKLNAVTLSVTHGNGRISEEAAIEGLSHRVEMQRKELLKLVLQREGSVVPNACKDLFWEMSKVLHQFYIKDDGFSSMGMADTVNAIIHEPITLNYLGDSKLITDYN
ncbi:ent-kaur-16-ene synthase, chloroplastic isoform X1 [Solanum pennellii]|uniref:Ent-kaur-16-ene synthase, chloroplastic isoform X1 n=2 Tax=Solanum pennellii TaxID=28526 RepID=A0ABM1HA56_SOLPN|nr:ent-kaur-16-ene synthase, chloroplastic isoform X1 [Solanum pennellii]